MRQAAHGDRLVGLNLAALLRQCRFSSSFFYHTNMLPIAYMKENRRLQNNSVDEEKKDTIVSSYRKDKKKGKKKERLLIIASLSTLPYVLRKRNVVSFLQFIAS
jgi:hypothetical protein